MSNLLACILACISVRDKHDEGIKKMCSTGISFGRSKLLQSCSNFTLKLELKPTVTACLAGRDAQEVLYTGFVHKPSSDSKLLRFLPDICNADIQKSSFSSKTYPVLNGVLNRLQRESWIFGKNYPLSVLTIVYNSPLLSLFESQAGQCSVLCGHLGAWWGCKIKGPVYSHETDNCLS